MRFCKSTLAKERYSIKEEKVKRSIIGCVVLAILALIALGCAPAATPAPTSAPPTAAATVAATAAAPTTAATAAAPATTASGGAATEVLIGAIHPLTGSLAQDGSFLKNGIDLAVSEINEAGGISCLGGAQLRVEHADSQGKPEVGQSEAERLVNAGAVALLGTYQSAVTLNATQVAERAQVPFLVTVAIANQILDRGFKYTFRIQPDQTQMATGLLEELKNLKTAAGQPIKTAIVIHEDSLFGTGFADLLKQVAPEAGIEIVTTVPYKVAGLTDLTTELTKVQSANPDIAIAIGYLADGILMARTAQEINLKPPLIGLSNGAFSTEQFVQQVGPAAEYIMDANYHYDASNAKAREVRDRYKSRFGSDMPTHGVMAYEAVYVLKDALDRACTTDRAKLRDAIAATSFADHILPYQGPIEFDEKGQAKNARSVILQVQEGKILQVLPAALAEAEPIFPPPAYDQR
jgi:branched-chain amino acid transport system substrate-binding protein